MSAPESKTCTACEVAKPLTEYYFEKGKPRSKCKDCHRAKIYKQRENREAFNVKRRAYFIETREVYLERNRAWWAANRDQLSEVRRERRTTRRDLITAQERARYAAAPEKYLDRNRRYALLKRDRFAEHIDRQVVWDRDIGRCGICGTAALATDWQIDHIVPLSLGGAHAYYNVQVAHPSCNMSKQAAFEGQTSLPV